MSLRAVPAPVRDGDQSLAETPRLVLEVLRLRRRQYDSGMWGVGSPALTRAELCVAAKATDRAVRAAIHDLRDGEHPIASSSGIGGYWISDDPAEIEGVIEHEYLGRIEHYARTARALRRAASALRARRDEGARAPLQGAFSFGGAA